MARLFLSAAHKSSGKTTLSIGIAGALRSHRKSVQTFKKGPDYIDPMWLSRASGRACYNLDFNTQSREEILDLFLSRAAGADIALIEGNKGLHDGVDVAGGDSSAALARLLRAPVVLVIDAEGMTRGVAPLVLGYAAFDPGVEIAGVILNNVAGPRQEAKMRAVLERYTDVAVLGAVGRNADIVVRERHLGLTTPEEAGAQDRRIAKIVAAVRASVDLDRLGAIAAAATPLRKPERAAVTAARPDLRIAIARDSAFGFYYPDDLDALRRGGAELVGFDALRDDGLPEADGLVIGGGFPETHMEALEANARLRGAIGRAIARGLPTYAECGGLMYLSRSISWRGEKRQMVGAIAADAVMHERPQGRGLTRLVETGAAPWPVAAMRGEGGFAAHEFHYAGLENIAPETVFAFRVLRGHGIDGSRDGIVVNNCLATFAHLRATEATPWAERFLSFVRERRNRVA